MDYYLLKQVIIFDKYHILVIEELLYELYGV